MRGHLHIGVGTWRMGLCLCLPGHARPTPCAAWLQPPTAKATLPVLSSLSPSAFETLSSDAPSPSLLPSLCLSASAAHLALLTLSCPFSKMSGSSTPKRPAPPPGYCLLPETPTSHPFIFKAAWTCCLASCILRNFLLTTVFPF